MKIFKKILFNKIYWEKLGRQVNNIIRHPKSHWQALAITALILIVIAFLLFLIIRFFIKRSLRKRLADNKVSFASDRTPTKISSWPLYLIMVVLAITIIAISGSYINKPSFCGSCHKIKPSYESWKKSTHKKIACLKCHLEPGINGYANIPFRLMSNYSLRTTYYQRFRPLEALPITNKTCRLCHLNVKDKIAASIIRVSHKGIDNGGFYCINCHLSVGHKQPAGDRSKVLSKNNCLICHNGKIASDSCRLCHIKDIGFRRGQLQDYTIVTIGKEVCGTCHLPVNCLNCHSEKELLPPKAPEQKLQPPKEPGK